MALPVDQFIGRFLAHVLPNRFMRIRHYGFMANRNRKRNLATIRELIGARTSSPTQSVLNPIEQWLKEAIGIHTEICPCCGETLFATELSNQLLDDRRPNSTPAKLQPTATPRKRGPP
jgi:hypothetical protein